MHESEIDNEKFDQNLKRFKIVLETRKFEIELFWKRCNYFLVLNTALAVGVFASFNGNKVFFPLLCIVGIFVCFAWIKVGLGSKFWQCHWEQVAIQEQRTIGFCEGNRGIDRKDYFSQEDEDASDSNTDNRGGPKARVKENLRYKGCMPEESTGNISDFLALGNIFNSDKRAKAYNRCVLRKPSVSRWMHGTAMFFFWVWLAMLVSWVLWKCGFWAWLWAWLREVLCKMCG